LWDLTASSEARDDAKRIAALGALAAWPRQGTQVFGQWAAMHCDTAADCPRMPASIPTFDRQTAAGCTSVPVGFKINQNRQIDQTFKPLKK